MVSDCKVTENVMIPKQISGSSERRTIIACLALSLLAIPLVMWALSVKQGAPVTIPGIPDQWEMPMLADEAATAVEDVTASLKQQIAEQSRTIAELKTQVRRLREAAAAHVAVAVHKEQELDLLTLQPIKLVEPVTTHARAERVKADALRTLGPLGLDAVIIGSR